MTGGRHPSSTYAPTQQRGFTLIVGLLMLVVLTVLSIAMFRSLGLQERIAGNTREKERALAAAQGALQYGEWWLRLGNAGTGKACSGKSVIDGSDPTSISVCSNALATPTTLPWDYRVEIKPSTMNTSGGGGLDKDTGDIAYKAKPGLYISYLGLSPDGQATVYQVTGYGYGGSSTTAAVVQSTYQLQSASKPLDGL